LVDEKNGKNGGEKTTVGGVPTKKKRKNNGPRTLPWKDGKRKIPNIESKARPHSKKRKDGTASFIGGRS